MRTDFNSQWSVSLAALLRLSLFMGAASNYMVSIAAQYWRRGTAGKALDDALVGRK
ncbi:MAG: hypothetical protein HFI42_07780 [Lachnospiraceae bacterium]|nr:hypothetical protein [Lachnospiraceae bacterium]